MRWLLGVVALAVGSCSFPAFKAEGKRCSIEDVCPASFVCSPSAGGNPVCLQQRPGPANFQVGRLSQSSGAPLQKVSHTLGRVPAALLVWTRGPDATAASFALGMADGTTQRVMAFTDTSEGSRTKATRGLVEAVVSLPSTTGRLVGWDSESFTLEWSAGAQTGFDIVFLVMGGGDVQAQILDWEAPVSSGRMATEGARFSPEVVFHVGISGSAVAPGAEGALGVMNRAGGQWAIARSRLDGQTSGYFSARAMRDDATFLGLRSNGGSYQEGSRAVFSEMTARGFALTFETASVAGPGASLLLTGVASAVGRVDKPVAPTQDSLKAGLGFTPSVLLVASSQLPPGSPLSWDVLWSFGAADAEHAFAIANRTQAGLSATTSASGECVWMHLNRNGSVTAQASALLGNDGFTLKYEPNDDAEVQLFYLALGIP